jgi:hypothetical protein
MDLTFMPLIPENDETGFYKFTCTFAKLKFGGGFKPVSTRAVQVKL